MRWEVEGGSGRNKVDDEAEIVETWGRRMTEIRTYIWESFGGATGARVSASSSMLAWRKAYL